MIKLGLGLRKKAIHLKNKIRYHLKNRMQKPRVLNLGSKERIGVVFTEPHDMPIGDRIMLYALVRGLKPLHALEIGVRWGGSARIITNAMEDNGIGVLVGLDPDLTNFRPKDQELHGRYILVEGYSPESTFKAVEKLNGQLDFVFIDAVHTHDAVQADLAGVESFLSEGGHIVFHDTYHQGIMIAVNQFLDENSDWVDCGILSRNPEIMNPVSYAGLRLIRKGKIDGEDIITSAYKSAGKNVPKFDKSLWNFDPYANRVGNTLGRPDID